MGVVRELVPVLDGEQSHAMTAHCAIAEVPIAQSELTFLLQMSNVGGGRLMPTYLPIDSPVSFESVGCDMTSLLWRDGGIVADFALPDQDVLRVWFDRVRRVDLEGRCPIDPARHRCRRRYRASQRDRPSEGSESGSPERRRCPSPPTAVASADKSGVSRSRGGALRPARRELGIRNRRWAFGRPACWRRSPTPCRRGG